MIVDMASRWVTMDGLCVRCSAVYGAACVCVRVYRYACVDWNGLAQVQVHDINEQTARTARRAQINSRVSAKS